MMTLQLDMMSSVENTVRGSMLGVALVLFVAVAFTSFTLTSHL